MPGPELITEAARQLAICNACRYCAGYCAVWPSIELRRSFNRSDVQFLANLCHDCRDCYYACQFAPPHQFDVNPPKIFAEIRAATYEEYAWPRALGRLVRGGGRTMTLAILGAVAVFLVLTVILAGPGTVFSAHTGPDSFYRVIAAEVMVVVFMALSIYWLGVWIVGAIGFWRTINASPREVISLKAFFQATGDAFGLTYLGGGGEGCNYPTDRFTQTRRWFHHLVFYGFLLDLASTTLGAFYHRILGQPAPYPLLHPVVVLGTIGGIGLIIGCLGLLALKARADRVPADGKTISMDTAFLAVLLLVAVTGMLLLAFRETAAMGTLLAIHLGLVAALYLTAPYGKFVHLVYRYAALVRYAVEQRRAEATAGGHH